MFSIDNQTKSSVMTDRIIHNIILVWKLKKLDEIFRKRKQYNSFVLMFLSNRNKLTDHYLLNRSVNNKPHFVMNHNNIDQTQMAYWACTIVLGSLMLSLVIRRLWYNKLNSIAFDTVLSSVSHSLHVYVYLCVAVMKAIREKKRH
jgi:hypothetical protein